MQKLYETYRAKGFEILAISVDDTEGPVPKYMKRMGLTFPGLLDTRKKVARSYGFWATPTTFFVTRGGMLIGSKTGGRDWNSDKAKQFMDWFLQQ